MRIDWVSIVNQQCMCIRQVKILLQIKLRENPNAISASTKIAFLNYQVFRFFHRVTFMVTLNSLP